MGLAFNPFTGNFDLKGSGSGGGASYIDGEVQNFSALPTANPPAVDSRRHLAHQPQARGHLHSRCHHRNTRN
jgi:hypothetical protein